MTNRAVVNDPVLAQEVEALTARYQDELIAFLDKARGVEQPESHKKLALAIGSVLASLGQSILFPIYRQHPTLTPPLLKDIIDKEAQHNSAGYGSQARRT